MILKEILENKAEKHISSGKCSISSTGSCLHKKFNELNKTYKEEYGETMYRIFAQGDFFHQRMVSEFVSKSPGHGYEVAAAEINIRDMKYFSGRCDMLLSNTKTKKLYVVDFKSCSPWAFKNAQKGIVSQTYQDQVLLYEHFFHIPRGYLLFINKASSEVEEFEVVYNAPRAEWLVDRVKYFFQNFVEKDIAPPRCIGEPYGCKCCWPDGNNKPTSEQLDAVLKQQTAVPELFKEFEPVIVAPESPQQPSPEAPKSSQEQLSDRKWVKVL